MHQGLCAAGNTVWQWMLVLRRQAVHVTADAGITTRGTDGKPGVGYHIKAIHLPDGTQITGAQLRELAQTQQGVAALEKTIADVRSAELCRSTRAASASLSVALCSDLWLRCNICC